MYVPLLGQQGYQEIRVHILPQENWGTADRKQFGEKLYAQKENLAKSFLQ